ncbi:YbaB/EbfC family nucleoid-associated protein [Lactovum odontotermitis]
MQNMQSLMRQAQKMQKQMLAQQEELASTTFVGKSAQNLVTATFSGDKKMNELSINPELIDPEDAETLQDMIVAAINDALTQIDKTTEQKMGKFANLPF